MKLNKSFIAIIFFTIIVLSGIYISYNQNIKWQISQQDNAEKYILDNYNVENLKNLTYVTSMCYYHGSFYNCQLNSKTFGYSQVEFFLINNTYHYKLIEAESPENSVYFYLIFIFIFIYGIIVYKIFSGNSLKLDLGIAEEINKARQLEKLKNKNNENESKLKRKELVESYKSLIAGHESKKVELKSTLRWCTKTDSLNKDLEFECLKTINAFLNSNGGFLFIGVDDDGKPYGIEKDIKSFGKKNNLDKFSTHLESLISDRIEKSALSSVTFDSFKLDNKLIFVVNVIKGKIWHFVKNNSKKYDFYIRGNSSSRKFLNPIEIRDYQDKHKKGLKN
ncbi:MAG: ATP-binding protein [Candidatus Woesearchaeota archaeon]|jgi:hypothetical protein|nr:ATP-binding protein [Candidatus Woesearchaeota archaeon]